MNPVCTGFTRSGSGLENFEVEFEFEEVPEFGHGYPAVGLLGAVTVGYPSAAPEATKFVKGLGWKAFDMESVGGWCCRRRLQRRIMVVASATRTTTAPMTEPTIAPMGVGFGDEEGVADGDVESVGHDEDDVFALALAMK